MTKRKHPPAVPATGFSPSVEELGGLLSSLREIIQNGAPGGVRTHNPRLRRPMLCPVELRAHNVRQSTLSQRLGSRTKRKNASNSTQFAMNLPNRRAAKLILLRDLRVIDYVWG